MKIVFFSSGKGSGHIIKAASLYHALQRHQIQCQFIMLGNMEYPQLAEGLFEIVHVPMEPSLTLQDHRKTQLYTNLMEIYPDFIITDGLWFPLYPMMENLKCKKVILFRQTEEWWFHFNHPKYPSMDFDAGLFDYAFSIEPGFTRPGLKELHPVLIHNREELYSREDARQKLNTPHNKKVCLLAQNGFEGELELLKQETKNFDQDFHVITTTNRDGKGIFPLAKYMNGIDLLIGGAGYNLFYESCYYQVPSRLIAMERTQEDQSWRLKTNVDYQFDTNGADELVQLLF